MSIDVTPEISSARIAHLSVAGEMVSQKRYDAAEVEILRALEDVPKDVQALNLLALVRYKLGRLEDAHGTYREITRAAPNDAGARRNQGLVALKLGRLEDALPPLEMAVRLAPNDERAWSYLGYAYAKKGEVVEAAAAFRRAGQDALAVELEHAAKLRRPPTPSMRYGSNLAEEVQGAVPAAAQLRVAQTGPVALAPPLPPPGAAAEAGARRDQKESSAVRSQTRLGAPAMNAAHDRVGASGLRPIDPVAGGHGNRAEHRSEAAMPGGREAHPLRVPITADATPVPLLAFVLSRLGQGPAPASPTGSLRLRVADEAHVRADAVLAGAGAIQSHPAFRRAQGRRLAEPLGRDGQSYFRLTGSGDVWIAGAPGRWLPVTLADDVLYLREDRVLAFDGVVSWEAGTVPGAEVRMLQFRGRGIVALELDDAPIAIKVTDDRPTFLTAARLVGWVGRLVPHGGPLMPGAGPFQLACQGEGVVLLDAGIKS